MAYNVLNEPLYMNSAGKVLTYMWGRRIGLDLDNMLIGPPEHKIGVTSLGSTANNIPAHGLTMLGAAAASTYQLDTPITGVRKYFLQAAVGSSHNIITGTSNIKFVSTFGSSQQRLCFQTTGDQVSLIGISSAQWAVLAIGAGVSVTT